MKKPAQAFVLGAVLGAACSASLGLVGLLLTQDLSGLADPIGWAIIAAGVATPWGAIAGGSGVWLLSVRARNVRAFSRLLIEATAVGGAIGLSMFVLGSYQKSGEAGPAAVMLLMTGGGAASALLIAGLLKSSYWPGSPLSGSSGSLTT